MKLNERDGKRRGGSEAFTLIEVTMSSLVVGGGRRRGRQAFTLVETVISIVIMAICFAGAIQGYILVANRAEWSAYNLAAHSLAQQRIEQTRAAKWDVSAYPLINELVAANFPPDVQILDVPISGTNVVYATNFTTLSNMGLNPPLMFIKVDCIWAYYSRGLFTNTVATYRAPDQ